MSAGFHAHVVRRRSQRKLLRICGADIGDLSNRLPMETRRATDRSPDTGLSPSFPARGDRMSIDQLHDLSQIADELRASADELAWRQVAVCRRFPSYDTVPDEDLHRSSRRNVFRVVETLHGRDLLPADISEDEGTS